MPTFREISHQSADYDATVILRERILRQPLGLAFTEAELAAESNDHHLAAFDDGSEELIGCLVFTPLSDDEWKMRQVAVVENRRGEGIGRILVYLAEGFARCRGVRTIVLHARAEVVPFYLALGYSVEGDPFVEVTIPHRRMRKRLDS
ncbi:MAG: GNAT family N-acetyltransferase [Verrucomicrobiae bacterium]|nr:GNAT family N-acetyltransferase [Verrucomicrobiae bacterium]